MAPNTTPTTPTSGSGSQIARSATESPSALLKWVLCRQSSPGPIKRVRDFSPSDPLNNGLAWGDVGVPAAIAVVLFGAAIVFFQRRDAREGAE